MVNIGFSWSSLLGIVLVTSGAALYLLRSVRPQLSRDYDIFFAAVALLCGGILFFQGWRQDPILQFGQFLLTGSLVFFAMESIRLRGVVTQQAKRNAPTSDYEESDYDEDEEDEEEGQPEPGGVYRAELDELMPVEERPVTRRIRGSRDERDAYSDRQTSSRRRSAPRNRGSERPTSSSRSRYAASSRRPRRTERSRYAGEGGTTTRRDRYGERRYGGDRVDAGEDYPDTEPPAKTERPVRASQGRTARRSRPPEASSQRRRRDIDVIRPADAYTEESRPARRPDREVGYSNEREAPSRSNARASSRYARSDYTKEYNNDYNDYVDYQPLDNPEQDYPNSADEDYSRFS
jgi:hypothetical protein